MSKITIISFFLFFLSFESFAQNQDTLFVADSLLLSDSLAIPVEISKWKNLRQNWKNYPYPYPAKAGIYSLVLPGLGQAYNKKYWKIPIIYSALGGIGYFINYNNKRYNFYKKNYTYSVDNNPTTVIDPILANGNLSSAELKSRRDDYNKIRQQLSIGFVAFWILNAADALVDAHLFKFDINEDLSFYFHENYFNNSKEINLSFQYSFK